MYGQLFRSVAARSATKLYWQVGALTNLKLVAVIVFSVLLQLALLHAPPATRLFHLAPLSPVLHGVTLLVGLIPVSVVELAKLARRRRSDLNPPR